jgi:hypothetical protein
MSNVNKIGAIHIYYDYGFFFHNFVFKQIILIIWLLNLYFLFYFFSFSYFIIIICFFFTLYEQSLRIVFLSELILSFYRFPVPISSSRTTQN